jgi:hypothetical protein
MTQRIGILFLVSVVYSCGTMFREQPETPELGYEMKSFRVASAEDCDEENCAVYEINFPVFTGVDSAVAARIRREIELSFSMGDPEADEKTIEQIAHEFIANYQEFVSEVPDMAQAWHYRGEARVNVLLDTLISLSLDEEYYTGGAHGGTGRFFINVDPRTGSDVKLSQVLQPGFEPVLNKIGEEIFRAERELGDTTRWEYSGFEFRDNRFSLNDNYGFTPNGLMFYFNNYEIGPYAVGPTEVFVSYERIKDWLKK